MRGVDRLQEFEVDHGVSGANVSYIAHGEIWWTRLPGGRVVVSWFAAQSDHPDGPKLITDAARLGVEVTDDDKVMSQRLTDYFESRDPRELIEVTIEEEATQAEVDAVQRVFEEAGIPAVVSANYSRRFAGASTWAMIIDGAFIAGFVGKAGANAWDDLEAFVKQLFETRRAVAHREGSLEVIEGRRRIALSDALPPEAFQALADLDEEGEYHWSAESKSWRKV